MQQRAGVRAMAERVGNGIRFTIPPAAREFLEAQPMVVVGSASADGWVCVYPCPTGEPEFVRALDKRTVRIDATPLSGDPLAEIMQGASTEVGVIATELANRRCMRLNGEAKRRSDVIYVRSR